MKLRCMTGSVWVVYCVNFLVSLPAKMSCKLWLNVWTCRSLTCPFTLRNLDRNPTAALISGFIVPRAQRVCIEKGNGDESVRCCCFFLRVCPTVRLSLHFWAAFLICWRLCCFSWHLLVEVEGSCFFRESPYARTVQCREADACCW